MKEQIREYIDWKFVRNWVIAITGYWLFRLAFSILVPYQPMKAVLQLTASLGSEDNVILARVLISLFWGTLLGFAQWLVLRKHLNNAGWWIGIVALIWALQGFWDAQLIHNGDQIFDYDKLVGIFSEDTLLIIAIIIGTAIGMVFAFLEGVLQWLVLYRQAYKRGVWIIAVVVAYGLGVILSFIPLFLVEGLIAVMTGAVMSWMLNHPFDGPELAIEEEG